MFDGDSTKNIRIYRTIEEKFKMDKYEEQYSIHKAPMM